MRRAGTASRMWLAVAGVTLGAVPVATADSVTQLRIEHVHTRERATLAVAPLGQIDDGAYRRANRIWRSWRTDRRRPIHPRLLRTLARIQRHFDGATVELTDLAGDDDHSTRSV